MEGIHLTAILLGLCCGSLTAQTIFDRCQNGTPCTRPNQVCNDTSELCVCADGYSRTVDAVCRDDTIMYQGTCLDTSLCFYSGECLPPNENAPDVKQCICYDNYQTYNDEIKECVSNSPPADVRNVQVEALKNDKGEVGLKITITPGEYRGIFTYEVSIELKNFRQVSSHPNAIGEYVIIYSGKRDEVPKIVEKYKLIPGQQYGVTVKVKNNRGFSLNEYRELLVTTLNTPPGLVQNLAVVQNSFFANKITLSFDCVPVVERNGQMEAYFITKTEIQQDAEDEMTEYTIPSSPEPENCKYSITADQVGGVKVGRTYNFSVMAKNVDYNGSYSEQVSITLAEKVPIVSTSLAANKGELILPASRTRTTVTVSLSRATLVNDDQGMPTAAAIFVCVREAGDSCLIFDSAGLRNKEELLNTSRSWAHSKATNFEATYRTTPDDWLQELEAYPAGTDMISYMIGADENCASKPSTGFYCNGPLPEDKDFVFHVAACNDAGCDAYTHGPAEFSTKDIDTDDDDDDDDDKILGLAIGLGVAGFLCLVLIIAVIVLSRRSKSMDI